MRFWKAASRAVKSCWRAGSGLTTGLIGRSIQGTLFHRSGTAVAENPGANCRGRRKTGELFRHDADVSGGRDDGRLRDGLRVDRSGASWLPRKAVAIDRALSA